jgi:cell division protease FtsH
MVVRWGMSDRVGPVNYADSVDGSVLATKPFSEATGQAVDEEVKRIADECMERACQLLTEHRAQLDALAQALIRNDSLNEDEILEVTGLGDMAQRELAGPLTGPVS